MFVKLCQQDIQVSGILFTFDTITLRSDRDLFVYVKLFKYKFMTNKEFKINLSIGKENVVIGVPSGEGLPNSVSLSINSTSMTRCSDWHAEDVRDQGVSMGTDSVSISNCNHDANANVTSLKEDNHQEESQSQSQAQDPIIPVEVSEETETVINPSVGTLEEAFKTRYAHKLHLYKHMCNALGKHVEFSDLTKPNLMKIKDWLAERLSTNTVGLYCGVIKACMNLYSDEGVFNCKGYTQVLKHKKAPSMHVYLSEEEIHKIEEYVPQSKCESDVKVKFLIECYTGARLSDVEKMSVKDIRDGHISYISKKTKVAAKIPVHKNLEQLLEAKKPGSTARSIYCRVIKKICESCGICEEMNIFYHGEQRSEPKWKFVGSHTARRSFATNLALRNVPIQVIARMMGHTDTKMTEKYILANVESIDDRAMEFFK